MVFDFSYLITIILAPNQSIGHNIIFYRKIGIMVCHHDKIGMGVNMPYNKIGSFIFVKNWLSVPFIKCAPRAIEGYFYEGSYL